MKYFKVEIYESNETRLSLFGLKAYFIALINLNYWLDYTQKLKMKPEAIKNYIPH